MICHCKCNFFFTMIYSSKEDILIVNLKKNFNFLQINSK